MSAIIFAIRSKRFRMLSVVGLRSVVSMVAGLTTAWGRGVLSRINAQMTHYCS
jgi:hypothetical protein